MLAFLSENWGNILVIALVAAAVAGVLVSGHRKKKVGGCGCGCGDCPSKGICHPVAVSRVQCPHSGHLQPKPPQAAHGEKK